MIQASDMGGAPWSADGRWLAGRECPLTLPPANRPKQGGRDGNRQGVLVLFLTISRDICT